MDFLKAFWGEYRGVIVAAGEKLLLALLVVLLGFIVCRILKRVVKKAADRIRKLDKAVGNIFYTAITRAREKLKIYWSPECEKEILSKMEIKDCRRDFFLLRQQARLKNL